VRYPLVPGGQMCDWLLRGVRQVSKVVAVRIRDDLKVSTVDEDARLVTSGADHIGLTFWVV